jgi:peptidoglycan-associated lipoprotein
MKTTKLFNVLTIGLALTCAVASGCKKKPGMITPMGAPGSKTLPPGGDLPPTEPMKLDPINGTTLDPTNPNFTGGVSQGDTRGHVGWKEARDVFQAETIFFAFDSSVVKNNDASKLDNVASYLKMNPKDAVRVEGNCDDRGTEEYNRALGERRALAAREELVKRGITPDRIETLSYGKDKPADTSKTEAAYSKNRRDEFVLLSPP